MSHYFLIVAQFYDDRKQLAIFGILAKYTMPIFVMHTLFVAPLRAVDSGLDYEEDKVVRIFIYLGKFINSK